MPIQDAVEMGLTLEELVLRVSGEEYHPRLFAAAFGDPLVTADRVARALAQFVRSIVSYRSRYDEGRAQVANAGERFPNFYDSGVQNNPSLDAELRRAGQPRRLNLTPAEKAALVAFLQTLTDEAMIGDPKFSDPFPRR
ncbi:MAG TPA: cytochrome-c peroxidase [Vicinamibacteria bacterium]|jgi:cytochrome c peroxidase